MRRIPSVVAIALCAAVPPAAAANAAPVRIAGTIIPGSDGTSGTETFTGCVGSACGMLEWNWHVTFTTAPETLEVLGGHGQARITGGTGALAGAKGSFTIARDPSAPCTYEGHVSP